MYVKSLSCVLSSDANCISVALFVEVQFLLYKVTSI